MKKLLKLKMNLQMFADGDNGTGGDEGSNQTADSTPNTIDANQNSNNDDSDQDNQADTPFKSFASEKDWQSSVDKLIASAIKTHDEKQASEAQQQKDYDKMTDLEKANYDKDQLTKQLADANRATAISNNKASVTAKLGADDLPTTLIAAFSDDVLADEKGVEEAYTNITKAFKESLQKAIDGRIAASGTTLPGTNTTVNKSEGAAVAEELNNSQQPAKSSLWTTK
ncbi:capsid assembly scaffolding protein Gp46 family protein [Lactiplantibacillus paraplantarum]|uniref:capsid assembly scaffolding protein Gp46 family protein n=1 Tax=Lactiplantibacillus paraplantarum TaxID=60520 RepID=UPI003DA4C9FC